MTATRPHDQSPPPLTRTIALMNQKGGVGKTTTTVNLAAGIARAGRRALLIDLDPQAHATLHLGVEPQGATVYDVLHEPAQIENALVHTRDDLAVLPAETDLAAAETELAGEENRQLRLRQALDLVAGQFDFILMDCPPSLGLLTLNGLAAAREVVIPMQAHFLALQGVSKLLETVQLVGERVNPRLRISGIVLCMHEEQTNHAREVVADLDSFFEQSRGQEVPWRSARVYRPAIRRNIKLAESPSFGQSIFEYAPGAPGASDYDQLAQRFVQELDALRAKRAQQPSDHAPDIVITGAAQGASAARA